LPAPPARPDFGCLHLLLFGARLLVVGSADIRLLVSRPPQTLAEALVSNPFWDFWRD
jgi:hypothetical protein